MIKQLIRSDVFADNGEVFFVSTINRENSSPYMVPHGDIYAETMAWEMIPAAEGEPRKRGRMVAQEEGTRDTIHKHLEVCERLKALKEQDNG